MTAVVLVDAPHFCDDPTKFFWLSESLVKFKAMKDGVPSSYSSSYKRSYEVRTTVSPLSTLA